MFKTIRMFIKGGRNAIKALKKEEEVHRYFNKMVQSLQDNGRFYCSWNKRMLMLNDATANTGFDAHYVYHTAWASRIIAQLKPKKHVDISSLLFFIGSLSAFVPVDFYDYRPPLLTLSGLSVKHADLKDLPFADNSVESLSCMHVVEHIGLERYGDEFDPKGDLVAMSELQRVIAKGGSLLFVIPMGHTNQIIYNAHRIYTYSHIIKIFNKMKLENFAFIDDDANFHENANESDTLTSFYGCGCFHFIKE